MRLAFSGKKRWIALLGAALVAVACGTSPVSTLDGSAAEGGATPTDTAAADSRAVAPDAIAVAPDAVAVAPDAGTDVAGLQAATVELSVTAYAFGSVVPRPASPPTATFKVRNIGQQTTGAIQARLDPLGSDFTIIASTCSTPLPENQTCDLTVQFNPNESGLKTVTLIVSSSPGGEVKATLSGAARLVGSEPAIVLTPTLFDFKPTSILAKPADLQVAKFTLANNGALSVGPFFPSLIGKDPDDFGVLESGCNAVLVPTQTCEISVRFRPRTGGSKQAFLRVISPPLAWEGLATLTGDAPPPAELALVTVPSEFPSVPVGVVAAQFFTIVNKGEEATGKLNFLSTNPAEFQVGPGTCPDALMAAPSGNTCAFKVIFAPASQGLKAATVLVSASPGGMISLDLKGTVSTGTLALSLPGNQTFGSVPVNETGTLTFAVENKGAGAVGKITAAIGGTNQAEFKVVPENSTCGASLAAGESCSIQISFTPSAVGERRATLQVTASPGGTVAFPLSGSGTDGAVLQISSNGVHDFGTRASGSSTVFTFTLRNRGTVVSGPVQISLDGNAENQFSFTGDCLNATLQPRNAQACSINVRFAPTLLGSKIATLTITATPGGTEQATVTGRGN
jgi:hypothetical protein